MRIGAVYHGSNQCEFVVWAPHRETVSVRLISPNQKDYPMRKDSSGYWRITANDISPGSLYYFLLDGTVQRPDPASNAQPQGVHGPSEVLDHSSYAWEDHHWRGLPLSDYILYELHVGTFTPEGTFDAVIPRLPALKELGISAVEIMPVAQVPGDRNWGYDGVYSYAVQHSFGGPAGLKRLVDACHQQGLAVVLDVVYNHLGPEGNYLGDYGPYFTEKYKTPWGGALNFDSANCEGPRRFFIGNVLYWFEQFHMDGLRLDAIHAIADHSPYPFLREMADEVRSLSRRLGKHLYLIAESDRNDPAETRPPELGGLGLDANWCDDYHHALHTLLTGESQGYYVDFGRLQDLVKSLREGFTFTGQYSAYRKRRHGAPSPNTPADRFIVYAQNHDQVGNRLMGDRLSGLISFEALKLSAGCVLLAPYIPLIFMGEEYGEDAPFLYFVSHSDPALIEAVRKGRREEFQAFQWAGEPPDPQSEETFRRSKISWEKRDQPHHQTLLKLYGRLIRLRRGEPALRSLDRNRMEVWGLEQDRLLCLRRWAGESSLCCFFNFEAKDKMIAALLPPGRWQKVLDSADAEWNGPGGLPDSVRGRSFAVFAGGGEAKS